MDNICPPVQYQELSESDVAVHLRYCASELTNGERAEFLLRESQIVIPIVKRIYQTKPSRLEFLIRSGSFGREQLTKIEERLLSAGCELKISFTSKRKAISRIKVLVAADEADIDVRSLNLIRLISTAINVTWPCKVSIGYALGAEKQRLPGQLERLSYV